MLRRAMQTTRGRLVLLLSAVGAIIVGTAALDHLAFDRFATFGEALWSATLHLLDPSSLQDDEGAAERTIGVFQVIAGLVLLVGVLFTLVADNVGRSIDRLSQLDPPVRAHDHLLIVGGANLLGEAATALSMAAAISDRRPPVVVLAPESARPERAQLLAELRRRADTLDVQLVCGDPAGPAGFELGAAEAAETVVLLPSGAGDLAETADVEVMQAGLALEDYLSQHHGEPEVRMLFRRGRHVDAIWDVFPTAWDAVVGDRVVAAILRVALTQLEDVDEVDALVDPDGSGNKGLLRQAREAAAAQGRPLRLTLVGCGISTPALMEDLAQAGGETRFTLTMLAERDAFEANLGREDPAGLSLDFRETALADPDQLGRALAATEPDVVLVMPSPTSADLRISDAKATLVLLHALRCVGPRVPVLAELFLLESVERLPADRRLLPVSVLQAVSGALALTIFDPDRSEAVERALRSPGEST